VELRLNIEHETGIKNFAVAMPWVKELVLVDGNFSEPGWQGARPPQMARDLIDSLYLSGAIKDNIRHFFPIPYPTTP